MTLQAELHELHALGLSDRAIAREIGFSRRHIAAVRDGEREGSAAMHTLVSLLLEGRTQARVEHPPVKGAADRAAERSAKPVGAEGLPAPDRAWQESNTPRAACAPRVSADRASGVAAQHGAEGRPAPNRAWAELLERPPVAPTSIRKRGNRPPGRMPTEPPQAWGSTAHLHGVPAIGNPAGAHPQPAYIYPGWGVPRDLSGGVEIGGPPAVLDPLPPFLEDGPSWRALERAAWWSMVAILGLLVAWAVIWHPDLQVLRDLIMWMVAE